MKVTLTIISLTLTIVVAIFKWQQNNRPQTVIYDPSGPLARYMEERAALEVDVPATFPGGEDSLNLWINQHLNYPEDCKKNKIQDTVELEFEVLEDGSTANIVVLNEVNSQLAREAYHLVHLMSWTPGVLEEKPTKSLARVSIPFAL